jgi:hypothetical protein
MWWIIIVVIAFIAIKIFIEGNKLSDSVVKQGGMKIKYRTLINYLLKEDPNAKIIQESSVFISIGVSGISGKTVFNIQQTDRNVIVEWKVKNQIFGNHQLKWTFDEFLDQNIMINKIKNDLMVYQNNVMQNFK